jgi:FkbM family methyltransferase
LLQIRRRLRGKSWRNIYFSLLHKAVENYVLRRTGSVIHIGAHEGGEAENYKNLRKNVVWIEADPRVFQRLEKNISSYPAQRAVCALLGDSERDVTFNVASHSPSSSIFDFGEYAVGDHSLWSGFDLNMTQSVALRMTTFDGAVRNHNISLGRGDFWIVDIQGAELLFLAGAKESLPSCAAMMIEVSCVEVYRGGARYGELKDALARSGFVPVVEPDQREMQHCDVLFVRDDVRNWPLLKLTRWLGASC